MKQKPDDYSTWMRQPTVLNVNWSTVSIPQDDTKCKHGTQSCEKCGTSEWRDVKHTTVGGKGVVGNLIAKDKKSKRKR